MIAGTTLVLKDAFTLRVESMQGIFDTVGGLRRKEDKNFQGFCFYTFSFSYFFVAPVSCELRLIL